MAEVDGPLGQPTPPEVVDQVAEALAQFCGCDRQVVDGDGSQAHRQHAEAVLAVAGPLLLAEGRQQADSAIGWGTSCVGCADRLDGMAAERAAGFIEGRQAAAADIRADDGFEHRYEAEYAARIAEQSAPVRVHHDGDVVVLGTPSLADAYDPTVTDGERDAFGAALAQQGSVSAATAPAGDPRGSAYVQPGEEPCGTPHPHGGPTCQLPAVHVSHARPASSGFDAWSYVDLAVLPLDAARALLTVYDTWMNIEGSFVMSTATDAVEPYEAVLRIVRAAAGRLLAAAKHEDESCTDDCERADHEFGIVGASMVWGTPLQLAAVVVPAVLRAAAARIDPIGASTGRSRASALYFEASRENARTLRTLAAEIEQGTGGAG